LQNLLWPPPKDFLLGSADGEVFEGDFAHGADVWGGEAVEAWRWDRDIHVSTPHESKPALLESRTIDP